MPKALQKKGSLLLIEGLNTDAPADYLSPQASPSNQNMRLNQMILEKRTGTTILGSTLGGSDLYVLDGREFIRQGSVYDVRIGQDNAEYYNTGSSAWTSITGTALSGTVTDMIDTAIPLLSGAAILCFTNGVDTIKKWPASGNFTALGGTPPIAKFIQEYKTYLVAANIQGGTDISQRVQWCDTADPENWSTGNAGSVDLVDDNDDISGLNTFGDYLCVHKRNCIYLGYLVSSTSIFKFDRRETGVGTIVNRTIVNLPTGEQIFLASDGIRNFNGILTSLIESPINEEIRDGLNNSYVHLSWGCLVTEKDEAWIAVPIGSQTTPDTIYKFNYKTRNCYKDSRSGIISAWRSAISATLTWDTMTGTWDEQTMVWNNSSLITGFKNIHLGSTDGYTYLVSDTVNNDGNNATAINAFWQSKDFETEEKGQMARWLQVELWSKGSGTLSVDYSIDSGVTWYAFTGSPVTLASTFPTDDTPTILYCDVISSKIRIRFLQNETASTFGVKQFILGYRPREFRR